jgi:DNA-binding beta-propeller fold protein YncE
MMGPRAFSTGLAAYLFAAHAAAVGVAARVNRPHPVGAPVEFAANGVGTGTLTFTWDFGDGQKSEPSSDGTVTHVYDEPGHYPVVVVVKDDTGARSDSFLQTVHRTLPERPPSSSSTIVHHRELGRVCNVNADNDTVSCLSTESLELVFEVPVGRHPRSLAVAPDGTLWVVNQDDASVSVLDATGALLHTIELPRASKPFGIVMSPAAAKAYVTMQASEELAEIDVASRSLSRTAPAGPWPTGVAVDSSSKRLFVTRFISPSDAGELVELDADSLAITRQFRLEMDMGPDSEATARGVPNYLRSVVPSPDGELLWVPSKQDNVQRGEMRDGLALNFENTVRTVVSLIDLEGNQELFEERADLNNRSLGLSLAFSPLGDYAFVGLLGNNGVEVLDAYNRSLVAGAFDLGKAPDGLVLDDNGRLYLNAFMSRSVVVLDALPVLDSTDFGLDTIAEVFVSSAEKLDPEVLRGKQIFYDASDLRMSQDGYLSCASCHFDGADDGRVWDFSSLGEGLRNTVSLRGHRGTGHGNLNWTGNFDEVQDIDESIRSLFGGAGFLTAEQLATGSVGTALGDKKEGKSPELDALAAYVSSLDQYSPSPFRNADGTLTPDGVAGRAIFRRLGCGFCHTGLDTTDSRDGKLHDVGTLEETSGRRAYEVLSGIDTPTLNGVWETEPYLHDGSAPTLLDVLVARNPDDFHAFTSASSAEELAQLVSYLQQLDGTVDPEVEPLEQEDENEEQGGDDAGGCSWADVPRTGGGSGLPLLFLLGAWSRMLRRRR